MVVVKSGATLTIQPGTTFTVTTADQALGSNYLQVEQGGKIIANGTSSSPIVFTAQSTQIGAWVFYNNDSLYECPYGKLYNWFAVADPRHVCPTGWHEPTDGEWTTLTDYLGGESVAGGKMKSTGLQYWISPNTDATNESGFSGLPGGSRFSSGQFTNIGLNGIWWSSSENTIAYAWDRSLNYDDANTVRFPPNKTNGSSVRCLRD